MGYFFVLLKEFTMLKFSLAPVSKQRCIAKWKTNHFSFPPPPLPLGSFTVQHCVKVQALSESSHFPRCMCCFIGECSFLLYSYPHPGRMELPLAFARHTLTCTAVAAVRSSPSTPSPHPSFPFLPAAIAVRSSSGPSCCCCCCCCWIWGMFS